MTNLTRKMSCLFVLLSLFAVNNYILEGGNTASRKSKKSTSESKESTQHSKLKDGLCKLGNSLCTGTDYIVGKPLDSPWWLLAKLYEITKADWVVNKVNEKMILPSHNFFGAHLTAIKRTITLALVVATCVYLLREDKQAAVESGKQAESETKLARLTEEYIGIEEQIENLEKEEKDSYEKQLKLENLNSLRNDLLDAIYKTYKENTPLLKRALNACRLGTFLGVVPYDEEEIFLENEETA